MDKSAAHTCSPDGGTGKSALAEVCTVPMLLVLHEKAIRKYAEFEMNDCQKDDLSLTKLVAFHRYRPNHEVIALA